MITTSRHKYSAQCHAAGFSTSNYHDVINYPHVTTGVVTCRHDMMLEEQCAQLDNILVV